ncbi:alkaline phosphatase family protein [Anaerobacillus sp. MEB173]|uniref:alkaline phosphatase family protein n=1 Tax=Anaerobacillus sp. MEB173 TaxID=3383345 RepID=UPI003F8EF504
MTKPKKPVILLILDTLMSTPLEEAVQTGYAPALQFLMERGRYYPQLVSSFPTMSVTIASTLLTGTYSNKHHLPALIWYHQDENRVVNYGTGIKEIIETGFSQFVKDMYYELNNVHLSNEVKTIHEELTERGFESASINAFVYRGLYTHDVKLPRSLRVLTGFHGNLPIQAPIYWSLGAFSKFSPFTFPRQPFSWNYKSTFQELKFLIKKRKLPAFTFCVIQDLDLRVHVKGPMDLTGIRKIDRQLQKLFNQFKSWDEAIEECTWIVMSDNGQASMGNNRDHYVIDLRKVLKGYKISKKNISPQRKKQIVLAVNQRTAFVYCIGNHVVKDRVIDQLRQDKRIDIIAWENRDQFHVVSGEKDGAFSFWKGGVYTDEYEQTWTIAGDKGLLDITLTDNKIYYGDFPDALARLSSSLKSHKGNYIVITAKPGYEFKTKASPIHVGGAAHGSLHKQESLVPMIVAGTDLFPKYERIVDLKSWIVKLITD